MDLGIAGKTALITGGSKGIGAGTAKVMAAEGCNLILVARGDETVEKTRAEIAAQFQVGVRTFVADLSDSAQIARLVARHGEVDILVNNAGSVPGGSLFDLDEAAWRAGWDTKIFPYINMCRAYYPQMARRATERGGVGVIINVLGIAAHLNDPNFICVGSGNMALEMFTQALGAQAWRDHMRVNGVSPGPVATERYLAQNPEAVAERTGKPMTGAKRELPFGRAASPEELGAAIAFAASERSAYTTGAIITVDGGSSVGKGAT